MARKSALAARTALVKVEPSAPFRIDLGCGPNKRENFHGVDALPFDGKVDTVYDLRKKWPWADGSVDEAHSSHFLEHLDGAERVHFFNELYRVLRVGAKASIIIPSWTSERAYGDPTHKWPPVCGFAFYYLDKAWRAANAPHVGYTCNFEFVGGNNIAPQWTGRSQEVQAFAQTHYLNVAQDIHVTLTKR